jgi:hypothetical protein
LGVDLPLPRSALSLMGIPQRTFHCETIWEMKSGPRVRPRANLLNGRWACLKREEAIRWPSCGGKMVGSVLLVQRRPAQDIVRSSGHDQARRFTKRQAHRSLNGASKVKRRCLRNTQATDLFEKPLPRASVPEVDLTCRKPAIWPDGVLLLRDKDGHTHDVRP